MSERSRRLPHPVNIEGTMTTERSAYHSDSACRAVIDQSIDKWSMTVMGPRRAEAVQ